MEPVEIKITDWQKARLASRQADIEMAKSLFNEALAAIICGVVDPEKHVFDVSWKDNVITLTPKADG